MSRGRPPAHGQGAPRGNGKPASHGNGGDANEHHDVPSAPHSHAHAHIRVTDDFLSTETFSSFGRLSESLRRAVVSGFGYDRMTKVQAAAIPLALDGLDVLAKAQTGTGKTIGFLLPCIDNVIRTPAKPNAISAVILSPTRELAMQINDECETIAKGLSRMRTVCVYGGTKINRDRQLLSGSVDILVATPGRFCDHLVNTEGFAAKLRNVRVLVLDEADRMLEMGFRADIDKILASLPRQRQTLLFSATVPPEIVKIAPQVLAAEFHFIDAQTGKVTRASNSAKGSTLVADDPLATAAQVEQSYLVCSLPEQLELVFDLLAIERATPKHKVIVYCTTARLAQLYAEVSQAMGLKTLEIHSRKSQAHRQKTSDTFREATDVIMFSSDVTARGMDYPDVTMVLQVGAATDREQYIHRLGRTARAGKKGRGILLLQDTERYFLRQLEPLPLTQAKMPPHAKWRVDPIAALDSVSYDTKACAYAAWLGYYNGMLSRMKWSKEELVRVANYFATECLGLSSPPALQRKTIGKMGLKGVPGLVIEGDERGSGSKRGRGDSAAPAPSARPSAATAPRHVDPKAQAPQETATSGRAKGPACSTTLRVHPRYFPAMKDRTTQPLRRIENESYCRITLPRDGSDAVWIEGDRWDDVDYAKDKILDFIDEVDRSEGDKKQTRDMPQTSQLPKRR